MFFTGNISVAPSTSGYLMSNRFAFLMLKGRPNQYKTIFSFSQDGWVAGSNRSSCNLCPLGSYASATGVDWSWENFSIPQLCPSCRQLNMQFMPTWNILEHYRFKIKLINYPYELHHENKFWIAILFSCDRSNILFWLTLLSGFIRFIRWFLRCVVLIFRFEHRVWIIQV